MLKCFAPNYLLLNYSIRKITKSHAPNIVYMGLLHKRKIIFKQKTKKLYIPNNSTLILLVLQKNRHL